MIKLLSENKVSLGWHKRYQHRAECLSCDMQFAVFEPPQISRQAVPVLYWLSGLTCNDQNFMQKAGAFRKAAELGIMIVAPDTSPRGEGVADDLDGAYDLGLGAGFYVNATQAPWSPHYQMYDYVTQELPQLIRSEFHVNDSQSISGHSMGGHGALIVSLKEAGQYRSASAFSPICHPTQVPWGQKAFQAYLGPSEREWAAYDACLLMPNVSHETPTLIDQGEADEFLSEQLSTAKFEQVAAECHYPAQIRMQAGYDHSYFFISSFIEEHLAFHAKHLF